MPLLFTGYGAVLPKIFPEYRSTQVVVIDYYCIQTTAASESMREIHHRMPLVLRRKQVISGWNSRRKPESFLP